MCQTYTDLYNIILKVLMSLLLYRLASARSHGSTAANNIMIQISRHFIR